jgi:hypothetical protein
LQHEAHGGLAEALLFGGAALLGERLEHVFGLVGVGLDEGEHAVALVALAVVAEGAGAGAFDAEGVRGGVRDAEGQAVLGRQLADGGGHVGAAGQLGEEVFGEGGQHLLAAGAHAGLVFVGVDVRELEQIGALLRVERAGAERALHAHVRGLGHVGAGGVFVAGHAAREHGVGVLARGKLRERGGDRGGRAAAVDVVDADGALDLVLPVELAAAVEEAADALDGLGRLLAEGLGLALGVDAIGPRRPREEGGADGVFDLAAAGLAGAGAGGRFGRGGGRGAARSGAIAAVVFLVSAAAGRGGGEGGERPERDDVCLERAHGAATYGRRGLEANLGPAPHANPTRRAAP